MRRVAGCPVGCAQYPRPTIAVSRAPWDLESHLDYDDEAQVIRGFAYGPSDANTVKLLGLAGQMMAEVLETVSSIFGEDRSQVCARFTSRFQAALGPSAP